jgi:hypothetical protein
MRVGPMNPGQPAWLIANWDDYATTDLGPRIAFNARRFAPKRTGALAASIENHLSGDVLIVAAHAPYAYFVERGTRPHIIRPRTAQALRWYDSGGGPVFASIVHHPGTRPEPYLFPALVAEMDT